MCYNIMGLHCTRGANTVNSDQIAPVYNIDYHYTLENERADIRSVVNGRKMVYNAISRTGNVNP